MPRPKIDGHFGEFSWLKKFVSPRISQIYISRIDPILLDYRPITKKHWFKEDEHEIILFLDGNGKHLTSVAHWENVTVGEHMNMKEFSKEFLTQIAFVLSTFTYTDAAIIYKSPAGISVPKWIEKQIADEKAKIHAEVEAIDAEYTPPTPPNSTTYAGPY